MFTWRIIKDLSGIVLLSVILFGAMNMQQFWRPTQKRGFYCFDMSIRKPILKDTIGKTALYVLGVAVPVAIIFVCELWMHCRQGFTAALTQLHLNLMSFFYGFAIERFAKNIGKLSIARLRPYFYAACQPIMANGLSCETDQIVAPRILIGPYKCSEENVSETIYQSFPSGHSSLAFYGMIFIVLYLQKFSGRCVKNYTSFGLLLPLLQVLGIVVATSVAVTRLFDYKHFLSDVIAGALLGITVAAVVSFYRIKYMAGLDDKVEKDNENGESQLNNAKDQEVQQSNDSSKIKCCSIEMEGL